MKAVASLRSVAVWLLAAAPLLLAIDPIRHLVESRMAAHMLLQFPLLIAAGWALSGLCATRWRWPRLFDALDAHGLLGISFASCVLAFWMIPTALDLALLSEPVRWAKYASLWLTGVLLRRSHQRLGAELALFFVGTLVWMMATVGLVYQTLPQRLCVSYLIGEQRWTGTGLVAAALLLGAAALWRLAMSPQATARRVPSCERATSLIVDGGAATRCSAGHRDGEYHHWRR